MGIEGETHCHCDRQPSPLYTIMLPFVHLRKPTYKYIENQQIGIQTHTSLQKAKGKLSSSGLQDKRYISLNTH